MGEQAQPGSGSGPLQDSSHLKACGLAHLGDLLNVLCGARGLPAELGEGVELAVRVGLAHLGDLLNVICGARGLLVKLGEGVKLALRFGLAHLGDP